MMIIYFMLLTTVWAGGPIKFLTSHRCPRNEHFVVNSTDCQITCVNRYVDSPYCKGNSYTGCVCNKGYVRFFNDATGPCIPAKSCPPDFCLPTCAVPNPPDCPYIDYSVCGKGRVLSDVDGECINISDCPENSCNGDPNAVVKDCPLPCPSTCDAPNAAHCLKLCEPVGCECKPGYLLTKHNGRCVLPEQCPGGYPCNANETFAPCKLNCLSNNCPQDDINDDIICELPERCMSGCGCKNYYRHKSAKDRTCIPASDCSPVMCTRPNEVWDPCPKCNLDENCEESAENNDCDPNYCEPRCVCKENFYTDNNNICVPSEECPPKRCRPTCAIPNPTNCAYIDYNVCKPGYVLSEIGGECIKISHCTANQGCNGDPHAVVKECPLPCPSTCDAPDAVNCLKLCDPVGCECEPGYIRSHYNGKCILPEECPCGYPCKGNQTFVQCRKDCSSNYCPVDDNLDNIICKYTYLCLSGCSCNFNYRHKSMEDKSCILAEECPPVRCTRQNELRNSCPDCDLYENCDDQDRKVCNSDVCIPRCICEENFYRNDTGYCVPPEECPDYEFF